MAAGSDSNPLQAIEQIQIPRTHTDRRKEINKEEGKPLPVKRPLMNAEGMNEALRHFSSPESLNPGTSNIWG